MKKFVLIAALCSFLLCMLAGYYATLWMGERDKTEKLSEVKAVAQTKPVIGENTKIIYRYKYQKNKTVKEKAELAPQYLYGLDMEQIKSIFRGWQVVLFSGEKVILQCTVEGQEKEEYILGILDDAVAVFYHDIAEGIYLKEKTDIPVSVLPEEELERLREGIKIIGEEELARQLSDFMS